MANPAITTRVEGLEESRAALERILRAERAAIPEALEVLGQVAVREITRRAPVLTGRLRRSYTYEVGPGGKWVEISSNVSYAPAQEFGSSRGPGTPHVRPGIEATIPQVPRILAEGLGRASRGAGGSRGGGAGGRIARTVSALG